ncbi:polysaccharide biosynthesis protein [Candidatus Marinimicrobia bacterium]|nr:polysaccharide biosynthesis protein [Candidatus Neomarinimicrobiota bacterium]
MWRYTSIWDMFNIIKANSLSSFIIVLYASLSIGFDHISRTVFLIDYFLCLGFISTSRLGIRMFFTHFIEVIKTDNKTINRKKILLIGGGDCGQNIVRQTLQNSYSSLSIIGILDDDIKKIRSKIHGIPIICSISELNNLNIEYNEIYIAIPSGTRKELRRIVEFCKLTKKPFKTLPSINELIEGKVSISQFREVSVIDLLGRKEIILDKNSISGFLKGKRILVTGAGGSIGSELVRQCIKFNPSVLLMLDISELNLFEIDREVSLIKSNILSKPILSDIRDISALENIFAEFKPQIVFHAAAYKHVPMQEKFPWEAVKTNIFGTINLSKISVKNDVEKFVLVSTDKAVKPTNVMGATKRLAEIIIQDSGNKQAYTEFMAVRFGNVLGSSGSVIPIFQEQIKKGGPITITNPKMERYFMSIPEASQLILQAGGLGRGGEIFILDMGKTVKIIDLASELIRLSGFEPGVDIPIEITGSRPGEKIIEELSLPTENLDKTKHEKIFVLNSRISNNLFNNITSEILKKKDELVKENLSTVKLALSNILDDYNPADNVDSKNYRNENEKDFEAKA